MSQTSMTWPRSCSFDGKIAHPPVLKRNFMLDPPMKAEWKNEDPAEVGGFDLFGQEEADEPKVSEFGGGFFGGIEACIANVRI